MGKLSSGKKLDQEEVCVFLFRCYQKTCLTVQFLFGFYYNKTEIALELIHLYLSFNLLRIIMKAASKEEAKKKKPQKILLTADSLMMHLAALCLPFCLFKSSNSMLTFANILHLTTSDILHQKVHHLLLQKKSYSLMALSKKFPESGKSIMLTLSKFLLENLIFWILAKIGSIFTTFQLSVLFYALNIMTLVGVVSRQNEAIYGPLLLFIILTLYS